MKVYQHFFETLTAMYDVPRSMARTLLNQIPQTPDKDREQTSGLPVWYSDAAKQISEVIDNIPAPFELPVMPSLLADFSNIEDELKAYNKIVRIRQSPRRFILSAQDSPRIRVLKRIKRLLLRLRYAWRKSHNILRRLVRKQALPFSYPPQHVPEYNLATDQFRNEFIVRAFPLYKRTHENIASYLEELKAINNTLSTQLFQQHTVDLQTLRDKITGILDAIEFQRAFTLRYGNILSKSISQDFHILSSLAGTIELPRRKVSRHRLKKQYHKTITQYKKYYQKQQTIQFSLYEHWKIQYSAHMLLDSMVKAYQANQKLCLDKTGSLLNEEGLALHQALKNITEDIEKKRSSPKKLVEDLLNGPTMHHGTPVIALKMESLAYPEICEKLISTIEKEASHLPKHRYIPISKRWWAPWRRPIFKSINVRNFIIHQTDHYQEIISQEREMMVKLTQQTSAQSDEIFQIIEYTTEYLLSNSDTLKDKHYEEFIEGVNRAASKALQITDNIKNGSQQSMVLIKNALDELITILDTNLESQTLYARLNQMEREQYIAQQKALITTFVKRQYINIKQLVLQFLRYFRLAQHKYSALSATLGISDKTIEISNEISSFLFDAQHTINRLPGIYQRLFQGSSRTSDRFYIEQTTIVNQMEAALENWKGNRYSNICITGEPGSGVTTTIDQFILRLDKTIPVIRSPLNERITDQAGFNELLKPYITTSKGKTMAGCIKEINQHPQRRIFVLENLHMLFLRHNNGFENIKQFIHLINHTSNNVFWVCSCSYYAWQYLNHAGDIGRHFGYIIPLNSIDESMLKSIILKRHRASGFNLNYLTPESFKPRRNYNRLNAEQQQEHLASLFFEQLYKHSQDNLSIAFHIWLRSMELINNTQLNIQFKPLDYRFLNSLTTQQNTTLHALLAHNGLTVEEHGAIFRSSNQESEKILMQLYNDGIILKDEQRFFINHLLYRHIVKHLIAMNFIYAS